MREFAEAEILPHVMEWDEAQTFPLETIRKLGKLGYMGSIFPEELGGAGLGYIEICPPGVDKATGLAVVVQALGVDPDDVLVFGDMPNDLPMFAWAGFGRVAVANAHPDLRAAADEVTLSNDDDGVARYLARMLGA